MLFDSFTSFFVFLFFFSELGRINVLRCVETFATSHFAYGCIIFSNNCEEKLKRNLLSVYYNGVVNNLK